MEEAVKTRIRFRLARGPEAAGLSHLEQIKALRAAVAACGLPFEPLKEGGNVPKMSFGPAVGAGQLSRCELADCWFRGDVAPGAALAALPSALPRGFSVLGAGRVPLHFPAVEAAAEAALFSVAAEPEPAAAALEGLLARPEIPWERVPGSGEFRDIRPGILSMERAQGGGVSMLLACRPGMTVRPEAVLKALGASPVRVERLELYWKDSSGKLRVFL